MCGLAGMVLSKKERTETELWKVQATFSKLLVATQVRGTHATGAFVINPDGISYHKSDLPASRMVKTAEWKELMSKITNKTVAVIGHVRFATHGEPEENSNNHPILQGNIIGVHNGVIANNCELCEKYPYTEEVDSAAIFSMLNAKSVKSSLSTTIISKALPELRGNFAIMCADTRRLDSVFVARDGQRPIVYIKDNHNGIIWLSSTGDILRDGLGNDKIKPVMLPAYSVARIGRSHAEPNAPVKVSHWYNAPKFIKIPESKGEYSTASLWEALGDTED